MSRQVGAIDTPRKLGMVASRVHLRPSFLQARLTWLRRAGEVLSRPGTVRRRALWPADEGEGDEQAGRRQRGVDAERH